MEKSEAAFRTIGEVSEEIGVPQHILRYWETRFPQLKPITRAGNRRYYRPADVALVRRIHGLLGREGYTVKGVQRLLATKEAPAMVEAATPSTPITLSPAASVLSELIAIRQKLADALAASAG